MLSDREILKNLEALDVQFRTATNQQANFCAKLAILECCGWVEEAMDEMIQKCYMRVLKDPDHKKHCAGIVKKTYGFEYQSHFKNMLRPIIGLTGIERLEKLADPNKLAILESALTTLKTIRDVHAHTYLNSVRPTLSAPSVVISQFGHVQDGLRELEARLAQRAW